MVEHNSGQLDYHGCLKPKHIFIPGDSIKRMPCIDHANHIFQNLVNEKKDIRGILVGLQKRGDWFELFVEQEHEMPDAIIIGWRIKEKRFLCDIAITRLLIYY